MTSPADTILQNKEELGKALKAIAEGYPVYAEEDRFIVVENPEFVEGERHPPNLVIDTYPIFELLRCMGTNV